MSEEIWICRKLGNFRKRDCLMKWISKWNKWGKRKGWRGLERQRPNRTFGSLFRFTFHGVWIKEEAQHKSRAGGRVAFKALTFLWCSFTKCIYVEVLIPSRSVGHQPKRGKRQERRRGPWARREEASGRQTSVNQLNFMPKYMYIGFGILGINPNLHKWHAPIIRLSMW